MRNAALLLSCLCLCACGRAPATRPQTAPLRPEASAADLRAYLDDRGYRRRALEASLVQPDNGYSRLRLEHYATSSADDWDTLPAWNPRVAELRDDELDVPPASTALLPVTATALDIGQGARSARADALLDLGRRAFSRYPAQLLPAAVQSLAPPALRAYGFWQAAELGGLVWAEMADGSARIAMSCATCHARVEGGELVVGAANLALDLGRLVADTGGAPDAGSVDALLAWGRGRLDVSSANGLEPVKIPDLRLVRDQLYLHADATVEQRDVIALAIRIETLIITSHAQALRPPREVALGLALFLWSLGDDLPRAELASQMPGAGWFATRCEGCHRAPEFSGTPLAIESIGTDPRVGRSDERGTGMYRVPSLRGVAKRGLFLHDGSLADLGALLDPLRLEQDFSGGRLGPGPVPGHAFGLDLSASERAALLAFALQL